VDAVPTLPEHVSLTATEYGAVLLDQASGQYWQLNPVGALVLRSVLGGATLEQTAELVVDRYQVDQDTATGDAATLLEELRSADLIVEEAAR
jgi:hypothetical protein